MVTGGALRQPDPADPVLDEGRVLSLVRKHTTATTLRAVDELGGEARAYFVDDAIVLKVQRPHRVRPRTSLEKEAVFLDVLARHPDISVPRALGYGRDGDIEYICMTRLPGVAARQVVLEGEERRRTLQALGRSLHKLHSVDQAPLRSCGLFPADDSFQDLRARLQRGFDGAVAAAHRDDAGWDLPLSPETLAETAMALIQPQPRSAFVALHSNPGPEHTFVDPTTLRFSGLIDFGDAYISHPAFDIRWPRNTDRQAVLDGYQEQGQLSDAFFAVWRTVLMLTDMTSMMLSRLGRERRAQARENLVANVKVL